MVLHSHAIDLATEEATEGKMKATIDLRGSEATKGFVPASR